MKENLPYDKYKLVSVVTFVMIAGFQVFAILLGQEAIQAHWRYILAFPIVLSLIRLSIITIFYRIKSPFMLQK